ncbi:MAG: mannose-6-phosphate isomerase, class I [Candidatus Cloacimonetes bacterium]|nr:mannose-6-phosphate isomerase, class I [Candidatus Cloacimonadota bacterium]MCF7815056.1 mannose-6-phosphate isomerase, class I [Candidatus Cloacimonadota bacterium]MCF7868551.1 mannose-6-phosphate isomerase, class I [Candidatus Cloacimonadota bacterium]MCF7884263.1 mannose-6-phosphate isomerase, class I [Candidatus Cloacimonadota bacterium]
MRIYKLKNQIQNYNWGTKDFIPELLKINNEKKLPCAELWMGAHPKAPSRVIELKMNLMQLIEKFPEAALGKECQDSFNNKLPFLLKILSAETPLSIQVHPSKNQAEEGFELENSSGKPIDAFDRNYKDNNHKPELICALTPFVAMCGFRPLSEIKNLLDTFLMKSILPKYDFAENNEIELKDFFSRLMNADKKKQQSWIDNLICNINKISKPEEYKFEIYWIKKLQNFYPGDIGVLSPLLLNLIELNSGEALYLPAGVLHAYLKGTGIEIMANSDNVLRGGLTTKHIDVPELLKVLHFSGSDIEKVQPQKSTSYEKTYKTPANEFELSYLNLYNQKIKIRNKGPEILFCIEGKSILNSQQNISFCKGESVFIPNNINEYSIQGTAKIFRAKIPIRR